MKKIFSIICLCALILSFSACQPKNPHEQIIQCETLNDTVFKTKYCKFYVIEIDGCEYLIGQTSGDGYSRGFMSHKGNCKYCEERKRKNSKL